MDRSDGGVAGVHKNAILLNDSNENAMRNGLNSVARI